MKATSPTSPAEQMPAGEVIASYHDLWHVEQSFRMSKTDLAALAIARHLQDSTGASIKKIITTLRPIQQITVRIAGHEHLAADPITPAAEAILTALQTSPQ